jgi:hypothetical protein
VWLQCVFFLLLRLREGDDVRYWRGLKGCYVAGGLAVEQPGNGTVIWKEADFSFSCLPYLLLLCSPPRPIPLHIAQRLPPFQTTDMRDTLVVLNAAIPPIELILASSCSSPFRSIRSRRC